MRNINYTIGLNNIEPSIIMDGGMQGDDCVTSLTFTLNEELATAISADIPPDCRVRYRIETADGAGGFSSTINLQVVEGAVLYTIPNEITTTGGIATFNLVVEILNESNIAVKILYAFPARVRFGGTSAEFFSKLVYVNSISGALEQSKLYAQQAQELTNGVLAEDESVVQNGAKQYKEMAETAAVTAAGASLNAIKAAADGTTSRINSSDQFEVIGLKNEDGTVTKSSDVLALKAKQAAHEQGKNNPHAVTKEQVGLENADNTSDLNKPVSAAQQAALNEKQNALSAGQLANIARVSDIEVFKHPVTETVDANTLFQIGDHSIDGPLINIPTDYAYNKRIEVRQIAYESINDRVQTLYINGYKLVREYIDGVFGEWVLQESVNTKQSKTITDTAGRFTTKTVEGALGELGANFTPQASKNLYNPANATDGVVRNYGSAPFPPSGYAVLATAAMSGAMAVEAGKTYCLSWPSADVTFSNNRMYCWDKNYNYLGIIGKVSAYQQAYGITAAATIIVNGRKQMIITIAPDSQVAYIEGDLFFTPAAHDTAEFDRRRYSVQLEEGTAFTTFEDTRTAVKKLSPASVPNGYEALPADVSSLKITGKRLLGKTRVIKNGNDLYIRNAWDSSYDIVEKISMLYAADVGNAPFEFISLGLIPIATTDSAVPFTTIIKLKDCTDDISPIACNGGYIGANHALYSVYKITKTAHGKTVQDVGSEWKDTVSRKFYIMKIVDANNLWVLSENTGTDDVWAFSDITGTTLTHSSGATHTADIAFTAKTVEQLYPALKNQTKRLLLDGSYEIFGDGVYSCKFLEVLHAYDVTYPPAVLDFVKSKVGSNTQPDFTDSSIAVFARISNTYRFYNNTSCTLFYTCKFAKNTALAYLMGTQSAANEIPASGTLHQYIPGTAPFTIGSNNYNFKAIQPITTLADLIEITPAYMDNPANPPSRFVQFAKKSDGSKYYNFGFTLGYCTDIGICKPAVRKENITSAFWLNNTTKKQYPKAMTGGTAAYPAGVRVQGGTVADFVAFRAAVNYGTDAQATNLSWYYVGNDIYLNLDYHTNLEKTLKLPDEMIGKTITVTEKTDGFTVKNSYVGADGIDIKVTNGYGSAVLKLSN